MCCFPADRRAFDYHIHHPYGVSRALEGDRRRVAWKNAVEKHLDKDVVSLPEATEHHLCFCLDVVASHLDRFAERGGCGLPWSVVAGVFGMSQEGTG